MSLSDRSIGYFAMLIALLICGWVIWQMHSKSAEGAQSVTVLFSNLGSLQPEDPVVERGVRIGHVRSTSLTEGSASVLIDFDLPLKYRVGTRFINSNYSLMGQRYIVILPQHKGATLNLKEPIQGEYEPGIAEAMHLVEYAVHSLDSIKTAIELFAIGSTTNPGITQQFHTLIGKLDGALGTLHQAVGKNGSKLEQLLIQGNRLALDAIAGSQELQDGLDTLLGEAHVALASISSAMTSTGEGVLSFTDGLDTLVQSKAWEGLVENRALHDSLLVMVGGLHHLVDLLQGKAESQSDVSFWKVFKHTNWNIFGATARTKRARRESAK